MPEEVKRKLMGENAAEFFNIPLRVNCYGRV